MVKKGLLTIEFLFHITFILICFIIVITFQIYIFYRTFAVYDLFRLTRVQAIENDPLFLDKDIEEYKNRLDFEKDFFEKVKNKKINIGSLILYTFKNEGLKINCPEDLSPPFKKYTLYFNNILPFMKFEDQEFYIYEPKIPTNQYEHISCDKNKGCLIDFSNIKNIRDCNYSTFKCNCAP
ncbi:MAG: hypothetical protein ACP5IV_07850 [Caldisericia bacterium]